MANIDAILIELDGFLFNDFAEETAPSLRVYQKINIEAKELLAEMQTYAKILGVCDLPPKIADILNKNLKIEGIHLTELQGSIFAGDYSKSKRLMVENALKQKYHILGYIDETEESPWHLMKNMHRLKY